MPALNASQRMRQSQQKLEGGIQLSDAEKEKRRASKKEAADNKKDAEDQPTVPQWAIIALGVIMLGSVLTQVYFQVVQSPSMSKER